MSYDDVINAYFVPSPPGTVAAPTVGASPARALRDAFEPLAMHAVWCRATNEALGALGLDFFGGYLWGRAAALGEPSPGVVVSSFAVFEPGLLSGAYAQARATAARDAVLEARTAATVGSLTAVIGDDTDGLAEVADALQAAVSAADGVGRPLFSGLADQPWPDDPVGRVWHACEMAREHRGDSNVAVSLARGLGPVEMNILTELWVGYPLGEYTSSRGWSPEVIQAAADGLRARGHLVGDQLSEEGRDFRAAIEADTDRADRVIVDALGDRAALVTARLAAWSQRCIEARAFPPSVHKRAAG